MTDTSQHTSEAGTKLPEAATLKLPTSRVRFDRTKTEELRVEYQKAFDNRTLSFRFDGNELLTAYAGYMLEYLDTKLGR